VQPKRRSVPGHPLRYVSKKSKQAGRSKMLSVVLLQPNFDKAENLKVDIDCEILSGYVEIFPRYKESDIRRMLTDIFKSKFPLINDQDYEFVKRSKNVVTIPSVPDGFDWGFDAIKSLSGQGKMYCRLVSDPRMLIETEDNDELFEDSVFNKSPTKLPNQDSWFIQPGRNSDISTLTQSAIATQSRPPTATQAITTLETASSTDSSSIQLNHGILF